MNSEQEITWEKVLLALVKPLFHRLRRGTKKRTKMSFRMTKWALQPWSSMTRRRANDSEQTFFGNNKCNPL